MMAHLGEHCKPNAHDIGSTEELPPGTDEPGRRPEHDQHAPGHETVDKAKPIGEINSLGHPGPVVRHQDIKARDLQWNDIGSGVLSRTFPKAKRLIIPKSRT